MKPDRRNYLCGQACDTLNSTKGPLGPFLVYKYYYHSLIRVIKMATSFNEFLLSELSTDIKRYAIENKLSYGEDEQEKFIKDMSQVGLGNRIDASKAWKSFLVSKEIFTGKKSTAAPKPAPAKPAPTPAKIKIDGSGIIKRYQKSLRISQTFAKKAKSLMQNLVKVPEA